MKKSAIDYVYNRYKGAPKGSVYIGRGSPWGNPYVIGKHGTRDEVIDRYIAEVLPNLDVSELKGKNLVCFCKPARCHGDYLSAKANELPLPDYPEKA